MTKNKKIVIAGASGKQGSLLIEKILASTDFDIIALSPSIMESNQARVVWRKADLFSLLEVEMATIDAQIGIFLSAPKFSTANLDQGNFEDFDYILSDNFSRAMEKNKVQNVLFIGSQFRSRVQLELLTDDSPIFELKKICENYHSQVETGPQHHRDVRSIQKLVLPEGKDANWVALEYMKWLPKFLAPIILVIVKNKIVTFYFLTQKIRLLELTLSIERSSIDRMIFYITGGLLAKKNPKARLEFRVESTKKFIFSAIHDFHPALPWFIYIFTQAIFHLWVMKNFGLYLANYPQHKIGEK